MGSKGVNIMEFCKQFNARTQDTQGQILPVLITVFSDKSFEFVIKTPPAAVQLMEHAKIKSGSKEPNRNKVGKVTWAQVEEIAKDKMADLNCFTVESATKMVAGTARSMGIEALEIIDRAVELGMLPPAPAEWACGFCDFLSVCGPNQERRARRKSREQIVDLMELRGRQ